MKKLMIASLLLISGCTTTNNELKGYLNNTVESGKYQITESIRECPPVKWTETVKIGANLVTRPLAAICKAAHYVEWYTNDNKWTSSHFYEYTLTDYKVDVIAVGSNRIIINGELVFIEDYVKGLK